MKKGKTFIFGTSGFIGSNLVRHFEHKKNIVKLGRNSGDINFDLSKSSPNELIGRIGLGDTFIFLAGISSPETCNNDNYNAHTINVTKTIELIDWLTKHSVRVIFCSSDAVFGKRGYIAYDQDNLHPHGEYAVMKMLVEKSCADNELVKIARFSYVLGGKDKFSEMLIESELKGNLVKVFKYFDRNVVLLSDVLEGLEALVDKWTSFSFKAINFSGPKLISRVELVEAVKMDILPNLNFEVIDAPSDFWASRAKSIATDCTNFSIILGREPRGLSFLREVW